MVSVTIVRDWSVANFIYPVDTRNSEPVGVAAPAENHM